MPILKLERLDDHGEPLPYPQTLHVNTDNVEAWRGGAAGVTTLYTVSGKTWVVAINADDLAAAIDPENACPDPTRCGYQEYLAYRRDGETTDLSHGGYHAAVRLAEDHGRSCRVYESGRVCPICQRNEDRIRA